MGLWHKEITSLSPYEYSGLLATMRPTGATELRDALDGDQKRTRIQEDTYVQISEVSSFQSVHIFNVFIRSARRSDH